MPLELNVDTVDNIQDYCAGVTSAALKSKLVLPALDAQPVANRDCARAQQYAISLWQENLLSCAHKAALTNHLDPNQCSYEPAAMTTLVYRTHHKSELNFDIDYIGYWICCRHERVWINFDILIGSRWHYFYCPDIDSDKWHNRSSDSCAWVGEEN